MRITHLKLSATRLGLFLSVALAGTAGSQLSAHAQVATPHQLNLCPPSLTNDCYIGYVTAPSKVIILLSSIDNDPLAGQEVEVDSNAHGATPATPLDLSKQLGSVVMLDAKEAGQIESAKVVSVADPLVTALYLSIFMQPSSDDDSAPQ